MCGVQSAVVAQHALLVMQQPEEYIILAAIGKRQIGQQVDQGGNQHEEHDADQECAYHFRAEGVKDDTVGDTCCEAGGSGLCVAVLPVTAEKLRETQTNYLCERVEARSNFCIRVVEIFSTVETEDAAPLRCLISPFCG